VETEDGQVKERLTPGTLYALDKHDRHLLIADEDSDLELISVFNPPLTGQEAHRLDSVGYSSY
jgi:L-ectoine synthase